MSRRWADADTDLRGRHARPRGTPCLPMTHRRMLTPATVGRMCTTRRTHTAPEIRRAGGQASLHSHRRRECTGIPRKTRRSAWRHFYFSLFALIMRVVSHRTLGAWDYIIVG